MAHPDLDKILDSMLPFAKQMIKKYGEFYPFGSQMDSGGKMACVGGYTGEERPLSKDITELLIGAFRKLAEDGKIRACGICYDVRTIPPSENEKVDAICVCLEHSCGEAIDVYLPYKKRFLRSVKYGKIFAAKGQAQIFITR